MSGTVFTNVPPQDVKYLNPYFEKKIYIGPPFYFCPNNNPFYLVKNCNGITELVPPKKALVFNKPEHKLSNRE